MATERPAFKYHSLTKPETSALKRFSSSPIFSDNLTLLEPSQNKRQTADKDQRPGKRMDHHKMKRRSNSAGDASSRLATPNELCKRRKKKYESTHLSQGLLYTLSNDAENDPEEEEDEEEKIEEEKGKEENDGTEKEAEKDDEERRGKVDDSEAAEEVEEDHQMTRSIYKTKQYLTRKGAKSASTPDLVKIPKFTYEKAEELTLYHIILIYERLAKNKVKRQRSHKLP